MRGVRDGDCLPMSDAASMSGGMLFLLWLCATPEVADRILGQRLPLSHVAEHVPDAQESETRQVRWPTEPPAPNRYEPHDRLTTLCNVALATGRLALP